MSEFSLKQYVADTSFTMRLVALDTVKAVASQAGLSAAKSTLDDML